MSTRPASSESQPTPGPALSAASHPPAAATPAATRTPPTGSPPPAETITPQQRAAMIGVVLGVIAVLALLILAGYYLVANPAQASVWRDVFIIFMALEALFIGAALIVLMVQIAVLTNVLKNEIKPILEATQETVNTVRGTTLFVSENLTEPIMKLNSYVAGLTKIVETLSSLGSLFRRP